MNDGTEPELYHVCVLAIRPQKETRQLPNHEAAFCIGGFALALAAPMTLSTALLCFFFRELGAKLHRLVALGRVVRTDLVHMLIFHVLRDPITKYRDDGEKGRDFL